MIYVIFMYHPICCHGYGDSCVTFIVKVAQHKSNKEIFIVSICMAFLKTWLLTLFDLTSDRIHAHKSFIDLFRGHSLVWVCSLLCRGRECYSHRPPSGWQTVSMLYLGALKKCKVGLFKCSTRFWRLKFTSHINSFMVQYPCCKKLIK